VNVRVSRASKDEVAIGLAALAIACVYAYFTFDIPGTFLADPVGAAGLPKLYAIALAVLALSLMVRSLASRASIRETTLASDDRMSPKQHLRAVGLLLPGAAYLLLISTAGYFATIFLLIIGVALYAGARMSLRLVAISIVGAIAMWVIFDRLFNIPLPTGSLWSSLFR